MEIQAAQREVRQAFLGGSVGQAVSGVIWLLSAALATLVEVRYGIIALVLAGTFIYPLTQLGIRLAGGAGRLGKENPMGQLAMQVAFIVPLNLPVIGAAALHSLNWFYPAFMVVLGTHYLPFMFLYGMWQFGVLAAVLIGGGVAIGLLAPEVFSLGGWFTGIILLLFAVVVSRMRADRG